MQLLLDLALALLGVLTIAALGGLGIFQAIRKRIQQRRDNRIARSDVPLIGLRAAPVVAPDDDLYASPRRLEELEEQLVERHAAVRQQAEVLRARQAELEQKGGRTELTKKYAEDLALLDRRADGMRRVLGLVWKTRATLLLRAHLAQTARRRPQLGRLPEVAPEEARALRDGTATYHQAAGAVRDYLDLVRKRGGDLAGALPEAPALAEVDDASRAAVVEELTRVEASYRTLGEDMDHLADNLTWLGDHFATLAVVESSRPTAGEARPGELIREVEEALDQLADLARTVDPTVARAAVENLAEDITQLEAAGLEAKAEADAELEIARLLRG